MLTIGAREPLWCTEKRRDAQQRAYADEEYGLRRDQAQRKLRINSQDALQTARNKVTHARGNVQASNITSLEGINIESEKSTYSRTNNVETFPELSVVNQQDADVFTKVNFLQTFPVTVNTTKKTESVNVNTMDHRQKNSATNTTKTPQRPQDLIDNGSLGTAKVNTRSSAQYRKSYAFKIWREKGCFPYRLADQTTMDDRKKSKKHLNAMKAQQDRQNEEAWKAFKNLKATNRPKKAQPPTQRGSEIMNVSGKEQPHKLHKPFSIPPEGMTKTRNTAHQNSIPDYFKTKKDASQKSQTVPVCKSIPTSVIYINSTKGCETPQPFAEANDEITEVATELCKKQNPKGVAKESSPHLPLTRALTDGDKIEVMSQRNIFSTSEASFRVPASQLVQWSGEETSRSSAKESVQQPYVLETVLAKSPEQTGMSTVPNFGGHRNERLTRSERGASPANIQRQHQGQGVCPSNSTSKSPVNLTTNSSRLTDQHEQEAKIIDNPTTNGNSTTSHEKQLAGVTLHNCDTVQHEIPEKDGNLSPLATSSVVAIVKSTLSKKYCKENVKPDSASVGVRGRKRRYESTNDEGEPQRGRSKQGKPTVFTRLDESVATNLADGIHNVNSEYFPIDALANKAAKETSKHISAIQSQPPKMSIKNKVEEINRARLLLKELFDVTSESDQDHEMQTFDVASRSFGRKNILNHLSLLDRYFAEFQKKLTTEVSSTPTTTSGVI